jgi:hypothetical protein
MSTPAPRDAAELARRLDDHGHARDWLGPDPYEGLNARRRATAPLRRSPLGRRVLIQAVKRSPVDLRRLLLIDPTPNAATIAQVASAYARGGFRERSVEIERLYGALETLDRLRLPGFAEPCWGYPFDVQSRVVFYPRGTPNVIATCFAGDALLDAFDELGDPQLLERAAATGEFLIRHIPQTEDGEGAYFGYFPGDRSPIHNASLIVAAFLARLASHGFERERYSQAAEEAIRWTVSRQRDDGSWPYGEQPGISWVDNYHTGYVLDALRRCATAGITTSECERAYAKGLEFFRRELVLADGTPRFYSTETFPIDASCVAQSIQTLSIAAADDPACAVEAERVFEFARRRMLDRHGLPIFQRRRLWANRIPHMRWVVAPLLNALTCLMAVERPGADEPAAELATTAAAPQATDG